MLDLIIQEYEIIVLCFIFLSGERQLLKMIASRKYLVHFIVPNSWIGNSDTSNVLQNSSKAYLTLLFIIQFEVITKEEKLFSLSTYFVLQMLYIFWSHRKT